MAETAADLVAELVRRADAAEAEARTARAEADEAHRYGRQQAVDAERYRQVKSFVRRWLNGGLIPAEHEADVRALCQLPARPPVVICGPARPDPRGER